MESDPLPPPVSPTSDEMLVTEDAFAESCLCHFSRYANRSGWKIERSSVTRSAVWDLIWRADISTKGTAIDPALVNRVVCWRESSGEDLNTLVALGQQVPPLD